jgi:hypothetical protein
MSRCVDEKEASPTVEYASAQNFAADKAVTEGRNCEVYRLEFAPNKCHIGTRTEETKWEAIATAIANRFVGTDMKCARDAQ